jgi:hypothetical protein
MAVFNFTAQNSRPQGGKVSKILLGMVDGRIPIQVSTSFFFEKPKKKNEKKNKVLTVAPSRQMAVSNSTIQNSRPQG